MTTSDALIAELRQEAEGTRRALERVPEDKLAWRPHPKSMSLGELALHVARVPGGVADLLDRSEAPAPDFSTRPEASSRAELLAALEESIAGATSKLASWGDEGLGAEWRMTQDGETLLALPRMAMTRAVMLNHWYHHRGQLLVYLRLLDVPVPAIYGDSADEPPTFARA
ncbi:MAG TPA: DinB family protein [Longimicrobiales bacterium]|nr:DinB family protein [Longimicrobiales bacterium]